MINTTVKGPARGYGSLPLIYAARFTPLNGADPTIIHNFGFATIVRAAEGQWDLTLASTLKDVQASGLPFAIVDVSMSVHADATANMDHVMEIISITESTGVIRIGHKAAAGASALAYDDVLGLTGITVKVFAVEA